jgi:hypothetical protein
MALRGNLKELSLPDIFQLVTFSGKTGVLRICREDGAEGSVWFRDGDVFFAQSNWHTDPLGSRLARAQRITPMALERAIELRAAEPEGGRRLGDILVDEGYITFKVLETFVQEQMQDTIFDLMRWDEGEFEFEAMPEAPEEDIGLSVSIENIIMEGSRRLEEWNRIKKKIPSTDIVFKMATAPGEGTFEISLKPAEWNLLLLIDGSRSVAELAVETDRTDFEVARIIYGLFSAGLLEFAGDEEVVRLRAERVEREEKLAVVEAERRAAQEAADAKAAKAATASKAADAEKAQVADAAAAAALVAAQTVSAAVTAEPTAPVEVPEFLGGQHAAPTQEDMDVLEQMMGAVLEQQPSKPAIDASVPEAAPYIPAEEPAFISASQTDEFASAMVPVPSVDDLLADLGAFASPAEGVDAAAAAVAEAATAQLAAEEAPVIEAEAPVEIETPLAQPEQAFEPAPEFEPEPQLVPESETPFELVVAEAPAGADVSAAPPELAPEVAFEPIAIEALAEPDGAQLQPPVVEVPAAPSEVQPQDGLPAHEMFAAQPPVSAQPLIVVPQPAPEVVQVDAVPDVPVIDLEPIASAETPVAAEPSPQPAASSPAIPGLGNFEHDLMSLGLGELPAELLAPESPEKAGSAVDFDFIEDDFDLDLEPVSEPMGVIPSSAPPTTAPGASSVEDMQAAELAVLSASLSDIEDVTIEAPATEPALQMDDTVDFSALLESLDISADDVEAAVPSPVETGADPQFDPDLLRDSAPSVGGVISTDAFLEDITLDEDFGGMNSELTDELSALTGADRPSRPSVNVNKIPDANAEGMLRRDSRVDRETLLKIIDGIKNL